jgi:hypothetical protein
MNFRSLFAVFLLFAGPTLAQTQTPRPLPPPPFLRVLPPNTQWVMENSDASPAKTAAPSTQNTAEGAMTGEVLRRESVKSDKIRRDIFLIAPNAKSERWMALGYLLIGDGSKENIIILSDGNPDSPTGWLDALDFRELCWVNEKTLKGWTKYDGRDVLLFEAEVPVEAGGLAAILRSAAGGADAGGLVATQEVKAWVDPESKLPIAYFDGTRTYRYSFQFNAAIPALPDAYRARIEAYIRRSRSLY